MISGFKFFEVVPRLTNNVGVKVSSVEEAIAVIQVAKRYQCLPLVTLCANSPLDSQLRNIDTFGACVAAESNLTFEKQDSFNNPSQGRLLVSRNLPNFMVKFLGESFSKPLLGSDEENYIFSCSLIDLVFAREKNVLLNYFSMLFDDYQSVEKFESYLFEYCGVLINPLSSLLIRLNGDLHEVITFEILND